MYADQVVPEVWLVWFVLLLAATISPFITGAVPLAPDVSEALNRSNSAALPHVMPVVNLTVTSKVGLYHYSKRILRL